MADFYFYVPSDQRKGEGVTVRLWRIWYGNGTTFDSNDGTWEEAPSDNVQVVILYEDWNDLQGRPRRFVMSGSDYYFKDEDLFGHSFDDETKTRGTVKRGKWLTDEAYEAIRLKAMEEYSL